MNGAPAITYDFLMGQLRLALVAVLAYAGGKGWLTPTDAGLLTALGASMGPVLVPWIWSIAVNLGKKSVRSDSVAIAPHLPGDAAAPVGANITGKVVGAIILALALSPFAQAPPASAQVNLLPRPSPAVAATKSFLDTIRLWVSNDIEGAITLATSIPELQDTTGATCWKTFRGLGDIISAHPLPVTLKLASDVQAARLVSMALKKVCVEPACAQVWLDMQNQVQALAPISTPFTLNSICSKVL